MGPSKQKSSHDIKRDEFSSDWAALMYTFLKDRMEGEPRIKDILCLILSYPMIIADQSVLKNRTNSALMNNPRVDFRRIQELRPLENVEGLIPEYIIRDMRNGRSSIFDIETATAQSSESEKQKQQLIDSTRKTEGKQQVLELIEVDDVIPSESILNLAADLAVEQLIKNFHQVPNIYIVPFSTRNEVEKHAVKVKIEAALKEMIQISDQDTGSSVLQDPGIETGVNNKMFLGVLWFDAFKYQTSAEVEVGQEISKRIKFMKDQKDKSQVKSMKQYMRSSRYLVMVVDGNGEKMLDKKQLLHFAQIVVLEYCVGVFLTTESAKQKNQESRMSVDLNIQTKDHLLPWVLFCTTVGCDLVYSSSVIRRIAVQKVEECRGYLLAIVLVAKSLMNKTDVQLWVTALDKMRSTTNLNNQGTASNPVMAIALKNIVWEDLNSIQKQSVEYCTSPHFPYKSVGPIPVSILIDEWVNNGIVDTPKEAKHILQELINRPILLESEEKGCILLPKETEDILQSLLRLNQTTDIKQGGLGLTKMPYYRRWITAKRIELMDNKISPLPPSPRCPQLNLLLLQATLV